jgi:uncharacterized protein
MTGYSLALAEWTPMPHRVVPGKDRDGQGRILRNRRPRRAAVCCRLNAVSTTDCPLSGDDIGAVVQLVVAVAASYGLAYWVFRATKDRSALVGLYLLFGLPGVLLLVVGAAFVFNGHERWWIAIAVGAGLCLPLVPRFRRVFASWTPMDDRSPVDMSGLCIVLAVAGFFLAYALLSIEQDDANDDISILALLVQSTIEIAFAYTLVGWTITRNFRQATARLGLVRPNLRILGAAVGFVFVAFVVSALAGLATQVFQGDLADEISEANEDITSGFQSIPAAILFGLASGTGEELLFRGAIQPKFGLVTSSVVFALLHTQNQLSFVLVGIFALGIVLGLERKYLGTTASVATHAMFNMLVVLASRA